MKRIILILLIVIITLSLFAEKGFMGITTRSLKDAEYKENKITYGVVFTTVSRNTAAEKAGIEKGDILLKFDGEKVYTSNQLTKMLDFTEPGDKKKLVILRNGKEKNINLTLGSYNDRYPKKSYVGIVMSETNTTTNIDGKTTNESYIAITEVVKGSPAEKAGIKKDDHLVRMNDEKIYTIDQFTKMLKGYKKDDKVKFELVRDEKKKKIDVILGETSDKSTIFDFFLGSEEPNNVFVLGNSIFGPRLGVRVKNLNEKELKKAKVKYGVEVLKVNPESTAELAGLKKGDVIAKFNGLKIKSLSDLSKAVKESKVGDMLTIDYTRKGERMQSGVVLNKTKFAIGGGKGNKEFIKISDDFETINIELKQSLEELDRLKDLKDLENIEKTIRIEYDEDVDESDI